MPHAQGHKGAKGRRQRGAIEMLGKRAEQVQADHLRRQTCQEGDRPPEHDRQRLDRAGRRAMVLTMTSTSLMVVITMGASYLADGDLTTGGTQALGLLAAALLLTFMVTELLLASLRRKADSHPSEYAYRAYGLLDALVFVTMASIVIVSLLASW